MKLLLTGATGFLGLHVAAEALRRGDSVRAVVRPATDARRLSRHAGAGLELVRLDLRSREGLTSAIRGVDVVVHLAADKFGDFYTQFPCERFTSALSNCRASLGAGAAG